MMNSDLTGALKQLSSAWEAVQLDIGNTTGPLSLIVGMLTKLLQSFLNLPGPIKQIIVSLALLLAAVGPILLVIGKGIQAFLK